MAIVTQSPHTAWNEQHPRLHHLWTRCISFFFYVTEGHIIVDLGRWIVLYCGRVSETAMLLATLWVTATYVTPELTDKLGGTALFLSSLSMIAFSLLPEVILFSAIIKTLKHWHVVVRDRKSVTAWSWALLYTLPTATFFGMTVYTIGSFVSASGHMQVASGGALVLRCLAGWFYSLVGLIHANMMTRKSDHAEAQEMPDNTYSEVTLLYQEIAYLRTSYEQVVADLRTQETLAQVTSGNSEQCGDYPCSESTPVYTGTPENMWYEYSSQEALMSQKAPLFTEQEKHTDPLPVVTGNTLAQEAPEMPESTSIESTESEQKAPVTVSPESSNGDASRRVKQVLRKHPTLSISELAKRAKVSRGYASRIRSQWLKEQQEKAPETHNSNGHSHTVEMSELVPLHV